MAMAERRTNHLARSFIAEMSQKAKKHAEPVSDRTGLPSLEAFDEGRASPFVAISDVNFMLMFNDIYGYKAGDSLLRRLADILVSVGLDAYHQGGDEFRCKGESRQELDAKLARARQIFGQPFEVYADGRNQTIEGADFCFGIGTTLEEADISLKLQKELRVPGITKWAGQKV